MLETIGTFLRQYPELAIFICLTAGYWIGGLKFKGFGLGTVVGTLIVGLIIGQFNITLAPFLKTIFFLFFMFGTGYQVGPQFFSGLRKGGLGMVAVSLVFCVSGLAIVIIMARLCGFDKGLASGLMSGGLTQSSVIGTATDAISRLDLPAEVKERLINHIPIADATTYLFGTIGAAIFLSKIAPRMLRVNLADECAKAASELGAGESKPQESDFSPYTAIDLKTYRIGTRWTTHTVKELAATLPPRVFIQRMRRGERTFSPREELTLRAGDIIAISGTRELLLPLAENVGEEIVDAQTMDMPFESVSVVINSREIHGKTLAQIVQAHAEDAQGIHLKTIKRQGQPIPRLPNTRLERGDIIELTGRHDDLERAIPKLGVPERPTEKTDFIFMGITCVVGILIGAISIKFGNSLISLGSSGGVLIAGLIFGWLHSVRPQYGRIPGPAVWLMQTLGLNMFIAVVGITAAPHALAAMKDNGPMIFLAGTVVTIIPHLVSILFGRYILKMNAGVLLGASAGAGTVVAALQSIEDEAGSQVPALGFTVPYALSNVILTAWGPVVVALISKI